MEEMTMAVYKLLMAQENHSKFCSEMIETEGV